MGYTQAGSRRKQSSLIGVCGRGFVNEHGGWQSRSGQCLKNTNSAKSLHARGSEIWRCNESSNRAPHAEAPSGIKVSRCFRKYSACTLWALVE